LRRRSSEYQNGVSNPDSYLQRELELKEIYLNIIFNEFELKKGEGENTLI